MNNDADTKTKNSFFEPSASARDAFEAIRRSAPTSVCFFNNKGGVGKTTLVANLAATLAFNFDAKVLLVDADPQCNLSQYTLSDGAFSNAYLGQNIDNSIYKVVHPLSIGKGYSENLPLTSIRAFGCDLVIGDPRLALKEDLLAQDWRDAKAGGTRGLRTTFLFHNLIESAADYDFVFFDMGPSLGAINRSILLAVDHFVVPVAIDIFSLWALRNIGEAVSVWQRDLANGLKLAEDPEEIPTQRSAGLTFLGYVTQQHKEKTVKGTTRVVEAYESIRKRLPDEITNSLKALSHLPTERLHLGDIKHLGSLAPKSQTVHSPMTNVKLSGSYTSLRKQAREIYQGISESFIRNIGKE